MKWSPQQDEARRKVASWLRDPTSQVFRLFGYAGTGKSTLASSVAAECRGKVLYAAFTGKAAMVMRTKGCHGASTLHSLIYHAEEDDRGRVQFVLNLDSPLADAELLIVDEVSMVDQDLGRDVLRFGRKVLVLGDPAQLPPVAGAGYFTHGPDSHPDVMLTEIHRQAAESPIIRMATMVRQGQRVPRGIYGGSLCIGRHDLTSHQASEAHQLIVGKNSTRLGWNYKMRGMLGFNQHAPVPGDRLVCLRNNREKQFFNGSLWRVEEVAENDDGFTMDLSPEDDFDGGQVQTASVRREFFTGEEGRLSPEQLRSTDQFTYGYALTCHKSQGSQWGSIVVLDESACFRADAARWQYTAITRAAERIVLVQT